MADNTLYLIDVFSLVFQVFHGIRHSLTGSQGQPTNAVFGFTRDLRNIIRDRKPSHLVCALDSPGDGVRNAIYAEYKANRAEMPADLAPQIPMVIEVIKAHRVPAISAPSWEADDVIATLTRQAVERGMDVCIISADKDMRQLLCPQVRILNLRKDIFQDEEFLMQEWGIRPDQVIDFQSLVGDSSDNVPGVPLVGPKKATALLNEFGALEAVLDNADKAPGKKIQENLKTYREQALMSRRLVTLNQHLELDADWETIALNEPDNARLLELFTDYGFKSFAEEVRALIVGASTKARSWDTITSPKQFEKFVEKLRKQRRFCVDLETSSLDAVRADIVGWAFSWEAHEAYYIPVLGPPDQPCLAPEMVLAALKPILEDPQREIVNQNIKYDMLVLKRVGVNVAGLGMDPMVGHYLLDAGARSHGLDALAQEFLNHKMISIKELIGTGKQQKKMFEVDILEAAEYASEDADVALQLADLMTAKLKEQNLFELYWKLERPLISILADMEFAGIKIDVEELKRQSEEITARLEKLIDEIHEMAGHEFNIDSPKQLAVVLFDELKLPVIKKTKTGPSTDQEVLEKLAGLHLLPGKMIQHRQLSKLKNTYLDTLPQLVNPETGRVHASFNQVVAATGRLSSSDPNLQNIPVRTDEGRAIRRAFVPGEPGWKLLCADYSQIELRILAHFCDDENLRAAFREGIDIHNAVAADVFNVPKDQVDSNQRRVAKAVNFGVLYGQSAFGLAAALGIEQDAADLFIKNYFKHYRGVAEYLDQLLHQCREQGYAETILGRRRAIAGIRTDLGGNRTLPERTAINTVIQGSAADLIKQAMINVQTRIQREGHPGRMLLQIHDELVFETPANEAGSLLKIVREEMETAMDLAVPLAVDASVGDNWLDQERLK